jgi:hypothetical protein
MECDQTAMGLPPITCAVFLIFCLQYCSFGKTGASRKNICDAFATPPEIKREWYVQSTAHQTIYTLWTLYSSYFKGISAHFQLQVYSMTRCSPYVCAT